jgi:hypothetical protein
MSPPDEVASEEGVVGVDLLPDPIDLKAKLVELQRLRDEGLISKEEFDSAKKELLEKWTKG